MQKNVKIGCFEHLWLHHIHVSVQAYTIGKSLFDPKKKFFFFTKTEFSSPADMWVVVGSKFAKNFHFFFLTQKKFFRQGNGKND